MRNETNMIPRDPCQSFSILAFAEATLYFLPAGGDLSPTTIFIMSRAAQAAMAASYKSLKEDFVSNLTGGEISEINYVTAVAPVSSIPTASNMC